MEATLILGKCTTCVPSAKMKSSVAGGPEMALRHWVAACSRIQAAEAARSQLSFPPQPTLTCSWTRAARTAPLRTGAPAERAPPPDLWCAGGYPQRGGPRHPPGPPARPGAGRRPAVAEGRRGAAGARGPAGRGWPSARRAPAAPRGWTPRPGLWPSSRAPPLLARTALCGSGRRSCAGTWLLCGQVRPKPALKGPLAEAAAH